MSKKHSQIEVSNNNLNLEEYAKKQKKKLLTILTILASFLVIAGGIVLTVLTLDDSLKLPPDVLKSMTAAMIAYTPIASSLFLFVKMATFTLSQFRTKKKVADAVIDNTKIQNKNVVLKVSSKVGEQVFENENFTIFKKDNSITFIAKRNFSPQEFLIFLQKAFDSFENEEK